MNKEQTVSIIKVATIRRTGHEQWEGRTADKLFICARYQDGRLRITVDEYSRNAREGEGQSKHFHVQLSGPMQYEQLKKITAADFEWPEKD